MANLARVLRVGNQLLYQVMFHRYLEHGYELTAWLSYIIQPQESIALRWDNFGCHSLFWLFQYIAARKDDSKGSLQNEGAKRVVESWRSMRAWKFRVGVREKELCVENMAVIKLMLTMKIL